MCGPPSYGNWEHLFAVDSYKRTKLINRFVGNFPWKSEDKILLEHGAGCTHRHGSMFMIMKRRTARWQQPMTYADKIAAGVRTYSAIDCKFGFDQLIPCAIRFASYGNANPRKKKELCAKKQNRMKRPIALFMKPLSGAHDKPLSWSLWAFGFVFGPLHLTSAQKILYTVCSRYMAWKKGYNLDWDFRH